MAELFGIDIAELVAEAIDGAGGLQPGTLIKGGGMRHAFQGFFQLQQIRETETLVVATIPVLTIIGNSLPAGIVPEVNDGAEHADIRYDLVRLISRDPAAAVYEFEVR